MRRNVLCLVLGITGITPVLGNESPVILESTFEDAEGCVVFNGLNANLPLETVNVSGAFTLNGGAFPFVDFDDARFYLRDRGTGERFLIGETTDQSYAVNILPGRYDLIYAIESRGTVVPHNADALLEEDLLFLDDEVFDIDVERFLIGGDFTLDGGAFPAIDFDDGTFHLRDVGGGEVFIGDSRFGEYSDIPVLPGVYDVLYRHESPGPLAPRNTEAIVGQMTVDGSSNSKNIDVPVFTLIGELTLNGGPFPASEFDDGNFFLENASGDRVFLGNSHDQFYEREVIPGTYDVYWEVETPGDTVPFNTRARVMANIAVGGSKLNIDVTTHAVSGDFRLNGMAFPNSELNQGRMLLFDKAANAYNELGRTKDQSYDRNVVAGTYDFLYQHLDGNDVPQNKGHVIFGEEAIGQDRVIDLNVPSGTYSASIYQNGVLFPADPSQAGAVILQNPNTDDIVLLGSTSNQNFSARVVPGSYDAYYSWQKGDQVPGNLKKRIAEGVVVSPPLFLKLKNNTDLNVTAYSYPGTFLLNGGPTPAVAFDDGEVFVHNGEDRVLLGNTNDQTFQVRLIYDAENSNFEARYESQSPGAQMPINTDSKFGCAKFAPPVL